MTNYKKTALITGASSGIGLELAKLFAQDGFDLILVARDRRRLEQVGNQLSPDNSIFIKIIAKDLSKIGAAEEILKEVQKYQMQVDVLVNNAGFGGHGNFVDRDLQVETNMMRTNMVCLAQLTHLFLAKMIERKTGKILNVASTAAFQPGPGMSIYYATKAFVLSSSQALAVELKGTGVSVTTLCPGPTRTNFFNHPSISKSSAFKLYEIRAEDVAYQAYEGLKKGQRLIVPGLVNRLHYTFVKFLPLSVVFKIINKIHSKLSCLIVTFFCLNFFFSNLN